MLYIIFQYGWEPVLTQWILIGFEAIMENFSWYIKDMNVFLQSLGRRLLCYYHLYSYVNVVFNSSSYKVFWCLNFFLKYRDRNNMFESKLFLCAWMTQKGLVASYGRQYGNNQMGADWHPPPHNIIGLTNNKKYFSKKKNYVYLYKLLTQWTRINSLYGKIIYLGKSNKR